MKAGSIDTAPPSSTENMSSAIAPSMIWLDSTNCAPSAMLRKIGARGPSLAGSLTRNSANARIASIATLAATP